MTISERVILLVEDDFDDARLVETVFARCSEHRDRIIHVEDLAGAEWRLRKGGVDAVLLDLELSDGAGVECIDRVLAAARDIPIVVLTENDDDKLALACISAGAQDHVSKRNMQTHNLHRALRYAIARTRETSKRRRADGFQARLAAIVASSPDAIISTTLEGVVTSWNSGAERIIGFKAQEAIGKLVHRVMRRAIDDIDLTRLASPARGAKGGPGWPEEIVCLRKDGLPVTLSVVACYVHDVIGPTEVAAICRDITDAKRRDLELRRSHGELATRDLQMRALAERLHAVRDEERTRISRTVHDELGQLLSALKMDLRWIGRRLGSDAAPSPIAAKVDQAVSLVDRTVHAVQRIALDLRSSALDAFGLSGAVREEARKFEERSEIATEVMVKCESEPARDVKTALFNIFQELLTNVGRHARASSVRVVLDDAGDQWTLLVEDDGAGFPVERHSGSLGILGMKERAESVGGRLDIESKTGRGTVAVVRVPHPA